MDGYLVTERTRKAKFPKSRRYKKLPPTATTLASLSSASTLVAPSINARHSDAALKMLVSIQTLTTLRIWELVSSGQELEPYFEGFPSDCIEWATEIQRTMLTEFQAIKSQILKHVEQMPQVTDTQEAIHYCRQSAFPVIAIMIFCDLQYERAIWRFLRPAKEKFFPRA